MGFSISNVKIRLCRARKKLAVILEDQNGAPLRPAEERSF
jgi:DNA-directed RNA polymerase specialized sigma24 family protein